MHTLIRKLNHRNIRLEDERTGDTVEVLLRDGGGQPVTWLGFIGRADAKLAGRPVKLKIQRVDGVDLKPGEYVHGCLTSEGVYGVIDSQVAIVRG